MKKEDEELLFKELCTRLAYRTMVKCNTDGRHEFDEWLSEMHIMNFYQFETKPYLRPLSSMTEEEYDELEVLAHGCDCVLHTYFWHPIKFDAKFKTYNLEVFDWLNAHHFDYRGLIEKGLALEAPEGMYK